MTAVLCALISGALLYASTGVNVALWPLAWLAPIPILWLAYGAERWWRVFLAAAGAMLVGQINLVQAYFMPALAIQLTVMLTVLALVFAAAVLLARLAVRRLPSAAAVFAFPCLWTGWEYLVSLISPNGSFGSWAYSQVAAPHLIQTASLFGPWSITFLLAAVASCVALALRRTGRARLALAVVAAGLFAANLGFGLIRLGGQDTGRTVAVAAIADDRLDALAFRDDRAAAAGATSAYAAAARSLAGRGAQVVVLPEKLAVLRPEWRADTLGPLQAVADETGALVAVGYDERGRDRLNRALVVLPRSEPWSYVKRRHVPGLERDFRPGETPGVFADGLALAICKDMDFPQMLRGDARAGVGLMMVPAFDFDRDARAHAAMAILRGVEGGYAVVRAARHGWVSVSDGRGRVLSRASTAKGGMAVAMARVGLDPRPTLYLKIGDVFAWAAAFGAVLLVVWSLARDRARRKDSGRP